MTSTEETTPELRVEQIDPVRRLILSRPQRRNALSRSLVVELNREIRSIAEGGDTRVVVLSGDGPVFCAGADLQEFVAVDDPVQLRTDGEGLLDLLTAMAACPVPIVAQVHGAAFGGGFGLVCAADIAVAAAGTRFSLSEARLGLIPAVISPYVIAALGRREATAMMLLAEPYGADVALRQGLIHQQTTREGLSTATDALVTTLLRSAPGALADIKRLPALLEAVETMEERRTLLGDVLARRRQSSEGQEGMTAFLQKRPPAWVADDSASS